MGIGKRVILILITMGIGINLMSCSKNSSNDKISNKETNYYSTMIDGKRLYYLEEDEDVVSLDGLAGEFLNVAVKMDYRNKEYLKEYDYYTKEQDEINTLYDYRAEAEEMLNEWELVQELNSFEVKKIEFYKLKGQESATVTIDYIATILEASDYYFEGTDLAINIPYIRTMTLYVAKEEGNWRVSRYELGTREKA